MDKERYKSVKLFWEFQSPAGRFDYLSKQWHILKHFSIHIVRCDWEDLEDREKEIIYKSHKKAVNNSE